MTESEINNWHSCLFASTTTASSSAHVNSEIQSKLHLQELRILHQEKLTELANLQSKNRADLNELLQRFDHLSNEYHQIQQDFKTQQNTYQTQYITQINEIKNQYNAEITNLQTQLSEHLATSADIQPSEPQSEPIDIEIDNEIANTKQQLSNFEKSGQIEQSNEEIENDSEDKIPALEEQLQQLQELYELAVIEKDEESKRSTEMVSTLVQKVQERQSFYDHEIEKINEQLSQLDKDHKHFLDQIRKDSENHKIHYQQIINDTNEKIATKQKEINRKQHEHNKKMNILQAEADSLKNELKIQTARQKQYISEAISAAKNYNTEKKKFINLHRELEIVNSELNRETFEHETLIKEIQKLNAMNLSQVSGGSISFGLNSSRFW